MTNSLLSARVFQVLVSAMLALLPPKTDAAEFEGPYFGTVLRIIDGDNFEANVEIWPTISATVSVRIKGIDAPELFRPDCPQERLGAIEAKKQLSQLLPIGTEIQLEQVEADDFSGRVRAMAYKRNDQKNLPLKR